jgi:hypothetical protein
LIFSRLQPAAREFGKTRSLHVIGSSSRSSSVEWRKLLRNTLIREPKSSQSFAGAETITSSKEVRQQY